MRIGTVILAAGKSKRMKSDIPKVIHPLFGKPLLSYSIETAEKLSNVKPIVVVGYELERVKKAIGADVDFVLQKEQLGTAHAVMAVEKVLKGKADVIVVINADMPLIRLESLEKLIKSQEKNNSPISLVTITGEDSRGFGRISRDSSGNLERIVEEKAASREQLKIKEYNAGIYCLRSDWLWKALKKIKKAKVGEYYLTDLVEIAVGEGLEVNSLQIEDNDEALGINNRIHFAEAYKVLQSRINEKWMLSGVTLIDPSRTYIEESVTIAKDVVIYPDTYLHGNTSIG